MNHDSSVNTLVTVSCESRPRVGKSLSKGRILRGSGVTFALKQETTAVGVNLKAVLQLVTVRHGCGPRVRA